MLYGIVVDVECVIGDVILECVFCWCLLVIVVIVWIEEVVDWVDMDWVLSLIGIYWKFVVDCGVFVDCCIWFFVIDCDLIGFEILGNWVEIVLLVFWIIFVCW